MTHGYPRPQLERDEWTSLDGVWEFAFDDEGRWRQPDDVVWAREIVVPFAPETPASGIADTAFHPACWYRRTFDAPPLSDGERVVLHFGAVDYAATVWVNGHAVVRHEGGYTPFAAHITHELTGDGPQSVVVRAIDDPHDLAKPRGKQDWQLEPHSIWYPRTSGIWQTVWLERVARTYIEKIRWTPHVEGFAFTFEARMAGTPRDDLSLELTLSHQGRVLARDLYSVIGAEVDRRIILSDPGIDDFRNEM